MQIGSEGFFGLAAKLGHFRALPAFELQIASGVQKRSEHREKSIADNGE
jgi:hypothetical protein